MYSSAEWQFHLWLLDIGIGIRATGLSEVVQEQGATPQHLAGASVLPRPHRESANRLRAVEESVRNWESEGGSLGRRWTP